ncbi:hypothetical protein [Terrisporobacter sp.]
MPILPRVLEPAFSIVCIFIAYKRITNPKRPTNKQLDDSLMMGFITFFVTVLLFDKDLYAILLSVVAMIAILIVEKIINNKNSISDK